MTKELNFSFSSFAIKINCHAKLEKRSETSFFSSLDLRVKIPLKSAYTLNSSGEYTLENGELILLSATEKSPLHDLKLEVELESGLEASMVAFLISVVGTENIVGSWTFWIGGKTKAIELQTEKNTTGVEVVVPGISKVIGRDLEYEILYDFAGFLQSLALRVPIVGEVRLHRDS